MKVKELRGLQATKAYNSYQLLLLAITLLPNNSKTYSEFIDDFSNSNEDKKRQILKDGLLFITLSNEDAKHLLSMIEDDNGITIGEHNIDNFTIEEIFKMELDVLMECAKQKIFFKLKKNL